MREIAIKHGGQCLSKRYIDTHTKLLWQCTNQHQWESAPANIRQGCWCPVCGGKQRGTIEKMQKMARQQEGVCLSKEYKGCHFKLTWQCNKGHVWETSPAHVMRGHWCPSCAINRRTGPRA
jgi:hypothetical protein